MDCNYFILGLLLVTMLIFISNKNNVLFVVLIGALALLVLNDILTKEHFNVPMTNILNTEKSSIDVEQKTQEVMITTLEDKLNLYKTALQEKAQESEKKEIIKIKIENSCGPFDKIDAMDYVANTENIKILNNLNVNAGEFDEM
jgi:hypothetical protein